MIKNKILVYGAGGHAKVIFDVIINETNQEFEFIGFLDDNVHENQIFEETVYNDINFFKNKYEGEKIGVVLAFGDNNIRKKKYELLKNDDSFYFPSIAHKNSCISKHVKIGKGNVIMAGVIINPSTVVGDFCIINTSSSIDHDCFIEDFVNISPGCTLGGKVNIGSYTFIGIGTTIKHNIKIGSENFVGAGSLITKNFLNNSLIYGAPAKMIKGYDLKDNLLNR
jgi:acetyltransferase EpsM